MSQPGKQSEETTGEQRRVLPPPPEADTAAQEAKQEAEREADEAAAARAKAKRDADDAKREQREAKAAERGRVKEERRTARSAAREKPAEQPVASGVPEKQATRGSKPPAPARRTRKASLRLVQVDAWSVMKTSFLLSIALGIVLVVAVAIIWSVLGAAGVWDSINSVVQQAVGNAEGPQFDVTDYVGTSRVLGFTMIVAVLDVILITAIATLGAFLYNLSAALLGGVEVTLAEDN